MKIRSKKLLQYLLEKNIDFQDKEVLAQAKSQYRAKYKRDWAKTAKKNKVIKPSFTLFEFIELTKRADLMGMNPTVYVREIVLSYQSNIELIPHREKLLQILQFISMAIRQNNSEYLYQAEEHLLEYLKKY